MIRLAYNYNLHDFNVNPTNEQDYPVQRKNTSPLHWRTLK